MKENVQILPQQTCAQHYKEKSLFYKVKSSRGAYQNCVYTAHLSMDVNASSGIVFPLGPIFTNPPQQPSHTLTFTIVKHVNM